jgi:hypothetical protein
MSVCNDLTSEDHNVNTIISLSLKNKLSTIQKRQTYNCDLINSIQVHKTSTPYPENFNFTKKVRPHTSFGNF